MSSEQFEFRTSGLVEFEPVDLKAQVAQAQAPDVDESQDMDPLSINFRRSKEAKPTATERMLAGSTIDWLLAFAVDSRPKALCERYPHVANRLAQGWSNTANSAQSLQQLVGDERWGSAGFPGQVQGELQRILQTLGGIQRKQ
jgi:hypothetical protein